MKKDTTPVFKDSYGNEVNVGDKIIIEAHYVFTFLKGQECVVTWDAEHGMYKYKYTEVRRKKSFTSEDNFYGVARFKKVE